MILSDALSLLDCFKEYIINRDIPEAINHKSNYLAALGLSTYTEIMSGFRYGDLNTGMQAKIPAYKRYIDYINNYFDNPEYNTIDQRLNRDGLRGLYSVVRSGLVHEYFIKTRSKIVIEDNPALYSCGISYTPNNEPETVFNVRKYFEDFKQGFDKYYEQLKNNTSGELLKEFDSALKSVKSGAIGRPASATSGGGIFNRY